MKSIYAKRMKEVDMVGKKSVRELVKGIEESFNFELVENGKYKEATNRRKNKIDAIQNSVSKQDFDLLQEYIEIENEVSSIEMEEVFVKGFSVAMQLIVDSLQ